MAGYAEDEDGHDDADDDNYDEYDYDADEYDAPTKCRGLVMMNCSTMLVMLKMRNVMMMMRNSL